MNYLTILCISKLWYNMQCMHTSRPIFKLHLWNVQIIFKCCKSIFPFHFTKFKKCGTLLLIGWQSMVLTESQRKTDGSSLPDIIHWLNNTNNKTPTENTCFTLALESSSWLGEVVGTAPQCATNTTIITVWAASAPSMIPRSTAEKKE